MLKILTDSNLVSYVETDVCSLAILLLIYNKNIKIKYILHTINDLLTICNGMLTSPGMAHFCTSWLYTSLCPIMASLHMVQDIFIEAPM